MTKVPSFWNEAGRTSHMVEEHLQAGWLLIFPSGWGFEGLRKRHDGGLV